jgi:hypothetical protein
MSSGNADDPVMACPVNDMDVVSDIAEEYNDMQVVANTPPIAQSDIAVSSGVQQQAQSDITVRSGVDDSAQSDISVTSDKQDA